MDLRLKATYQMSGAKKKTTYFEQQSPFWYGINTQFAINNACVMAENKWYDEFIE